jgi:hypothetical protein
VRPVQETFFEADELLELSRLQAELEERQRLIQAQIDSLTELDAPQRAPSPVSRPAPSGPRPLSISQEIRQIQDIEYSEAVDESRRQDAEQRRTEEERRAGEAEQQKRVDDLMAQFRQLPPEPDSGPTIAVSLSGKGRVVRRFDPETYGRIVYIWVAGLSQESHRRLAIDNFELKSTVGNVKLEVDQTLSEQAITGRNMFAISEL